MRLKSTEKAHRQSRLGERKTLNRLGLSRTFAVAANNLDPVRLDSRLVIQLESDILDQEGPDIITEPVGVKVALFYRSTDSSQHYESASSNQSIHKKKLP